MCSDDLYASAALCPKGVRQETISVASILDRYDARLKYLKMHYSGSPMPLMPSSGSSHIFVCDGYNQDFLHYNFGWEGDCNGWYRAIVIPSMNDSQLPFTSMIAGISPLP